VQHFRAPLAQASDLFFDLPWGSHAFDNARRSLDIP
jgi:hypothetical protein